MNWSVLTALITAGSAVAAVFYTGRSVDATRDQVIIAQRQNEVAQQGQFTDRYGKAVEQLDKAGADHLQGRLGGVYALERLAHDSPPDQPTIIEVLNAFIRTTTPLPTPLQPSDLKQPSSVRIDNCPDQPVGFDVQAAITVLGRRNTKNDQKTHLDFSEACLRNADLRHADLDTANLVGAKLSGAKLDNANLSNADLSDTKLLDVVFNKVNLDHTNFTRANLRAANLNNADLTGANFNGANLRSAKLRGANLKGGHFIDADLTGADLSGADLTGADLTGTDLTDVFHDNSTLVVNTTRSAKTKATWWP